MVQPLLFPGVIRTVMNFMDSFFYNIPNPQQKRIIELKRFFDKIEMFTFKVTNIFLALMSLVHICLYMNGLQFAWDLRFWTCGFGLDIYD